MINIYCGSVLLNNTLANTTSRVDNDSVTSDRDDGTHGRHIVQIRYLGEQLKKGRLLCGEILHLSSFIGDRRFGLGMVKW